MQHARTATAHPRAGQHVLSLGTATDGGGQSQLLRILVVEVILVLRQLLEQIQIRRKAITVSYAEGDFSNTSAATVHPSLEGLADGHLSRQDLLCAQRLLSAKCGSGEGPIPSASSSPDNLPRRPDTESCRDPVLGQRDRPESHAATKARQGTWRK